MTEQTTDTKTFNGKGLTRLAWGALFVGIGVLISGLIMFLWGEELSGTEPLKADKVGQFGDLIGGLVGSLWALAGVLFFYVALREQRQDFKTNSDVLKAQQKALEQQTLEFKLQKEEMEQTREVFKLQSETLRQQQFENTFFNMIDNIDDVRNNLVETEWVNSNPGGYETTKVDHNSISFFDKIHSSLNRLQTFYEIEFFYEGNYHYEHLGIDVYKDKEQKVRTEKVLGSRKLYLRNLGGVQSEYNLNEAKRSIFHDKNTKLDQAIVTYKTFYRFKRKNVAHYHRLVYHTLKFVKDYWQSHNGKHIAAIQRYADILQAQFSKNELVFIYYNSLIFPKMFELIKEFQFVENLYEEDLLDPEHRHPEIKMKKETEILGQ